MINPLTKLVFAAICISLSSCTTGLIYNNTVEPYCTNMDKTPNIGSSAEYPLKQIRIPTIPGATIRWDSQTINDIAKSAGMNKVAFCDRKIFSVLRGIWSTDYIVVYGE